MKVTGIIAEYNPFHYGHEYNIKKAKELTGCDYCIVVMSGNYVQRGTPALIDKYSRTEMALRGGADLVLELPVPFACGCAEIFACAAVSLLCSIGCCDCLCFGSEAAVRLSDMKTAADILTNEPEAYRRILKEKLALGNSYPKSMSEALTAYIDRYCPEHDSSISDIIASPNNLLAVEYLKALIKNSSDIQPVSIQRTGNGYHSLSTENGFASASAVRSALDDLEDITAIKAHVPDYSYNIMASKYKQTFPVTENDFSAMLSYALLGNDSLTDIADMTKELASRIQKISFRPHTFSELAAALKTKNITYARICRALMHTILKTDSQSMEIYKSHDCCLYARILGMRLSCTPLLHSIKKNSSVPIVTKLPDALKTLPPEAAALLKQEIYADRLYSQAVYTRFHQYLPDAFHSQIIRL